MKDLIRWGLARDRGSLAATALCFAAFYVWALLMWSFS